MANYKVGDLEVTINGVSKDAVSSLDRVIEQLDSLQGKLNVVSKGFGSAFEGISRSTINATTQGLGEISKGTEEATDSAEKFGLEIQNAVGISEQGLGEISKGTEEAARAFEEATDSAEKVVKVLSGFDEARTQVSHLSNELLNLHFESGAFDESKVNEMLALTKQIEATSEAFKRLGMTEEELFVYDNKQVEVTNKKRMEYLKLALATNSAGESAETYLQELIELSRQEYELAQSMKTLEQTVKNVVAPVDLEPVKSATAFMVSELEQATTKVSELKKQLTEMFYSTGTLDSGSAQELQDLTSKINAANEAVKRLSMTEQELALYEFEQENASRKQRIAYLNLMLATGQAAEKTREYREELKKLKEEQEQADKAAGTQKNGILGNLINRIARISIYRTIRRGLQILVQTFKESVQSFAMVDDSINNTMSQLTSSTKVIQLSFGTVILPIVQAITPAVQQLSYGFANMANAINASLAKMQGLSTYTKINADALQDYRKQLNKTSGALFDFDKFRALSSSGQDNSIFLETADVNEELENTSILYSGIFDTISSIGNILANILSIVVQIVDTASPILGVIFKIAGWMLKIVGYVVDFVAESELIEPILYGILTVLTLIGVSKIVTWFSSGAALNAITTFATTIWTKLITALEGANGAFISWGISIGAVVAAIKILSNWDDFNTGTKIAITVISGLATALLAAATAAMVLHGTLSFGTAIPLITAAVASGVVFIKGLVDIPNYAVGASNIDSGSLFVAGEAGKTEMVYTGDNGKTNVANVQQMAQAVYQGTYQATMDWWKSAKNEVGGDVYLDGEKLYQSVGKTASKHGKKFANV